MEVGQAVLYSAYPRLPDDPSVVSIRLLKRSTIDCELAVKVYQISSLLSVLVQEGSGEERVAPFVLAANDEVQLIPKGWVNIDIALVHSSLGGALGISCIQKLKVAALVVLVVQNLTK